MVRGIFLKNKKWMLTILCVNARFPIMNKTKFKENLPGVISLGIVVCFLAFFVYCFLGYCFAWSSLSVSANIEKKFNQLPSEVLMKKVNGFYIWIDKQGYAIDELAMRKERKTVPLFVEIVKKRKHKRTNQVIRALAKIGDDRAIEPLREIVNNGREDEYYLSALGSLATIHDEGIYLEIIKMVDDNFKIWIALDFLECFPEKEQTYIKVVEIIDRHLERKEFSYSIKAIKLLVKLYGERAMEPLMKIIENGKDDEYYLCALEELSNLRRVEVYPEIIKLIESGEAPKLAYRCLKNFPKNEKNLDALMKLVPQDLNKGAIDMLIALGGVRAIKPLTEVLEKNKRSTATYFYAKGRLKELRGIKAKIDKSVIVKTIDPIESIQKEQQSKK